MIEFDDKDIQKEFNECHSRQEYDGVDICRSMCMPCGRAIENGQCSMLVDYFSKQKEADNETDN